MPHFTADLSQIQVALEVFTKGDYEFIVGEPKSFQRTNEKGVETFGVRWPLQLGLEANGYKAGTKQIYTGYLHTDGAQSFIKQFVMSCLGYNPKSKEDEKKFDAEMKGQDWGIDTETQGVGDVYRRTTGKRLIVSLDTGINPNSGEPSQQFKGFRPLQNK